MALMTNVSSQSCIHVHVYMWHAAIQVYEFVKLYTYISGIRGYELVKLHLSCS